MIKHFEYFAFFQKFGVIDSSKKKKKQQPWYLGQTARLSKSSDRCAVHTTQLSLMESGVLHQWWGGSHTYKSHRWEVTWEWRVTRAVQVVCVLTCSEKNKKKQKVTCVREWIRKLLEKGLFLQWKTETACLCFGSGRTTVTYNEQLVCILTMGCYCGTTWIDTW